MTADETIDAPGLADEPCEGRADHAIETSIKIYLDWHDGRWSVSHHSVDGDALDERDSGPAAVCEHATSEERAECDRQLAHAEVAALPTGLELMEMLADVATRLAADATAPVRPSAETLRRAALATRATLHSAAMTS